MALSSSIDVAEEDKATATAARKEAHADYQATHADYVESVGDLTAAIQTVKTTMSSVSGASAASLLQTLSTKPHMPAHAKRVLATFFETSSSSERMLAEGINEGKEIYTG